MSLERSVVILITGMALVFLSLALSGVIYFGDLAVGSVFDGDGFVWKHWVFFLVLLAALGLVGLGWLTWVRVHNRWIRESLLVDWDRVEPLC